MVNQGRYGGRQLGRVGGEGGEDAEQRLGEPQSLPDPLDPRDEDPAGAQADGGSDDEDDSSEGRFQPQEALSGVGPHELEHRVGAFDAKRRVLWEDPLGSH